MAKLLCVANCQARKNGYIINCNRGTFYELSSTDDFPRDCFRGEMPIVKEAPKRKRKKTE